MLAFLKCPTLPSVLLAPHPSLNPLTHIFQLYGIIVLALIPLMLLITQLTPSLAADEHAVGQLAQATHPLRFLLLTVIVAPIIEEIAFRWPLRYSPIGLACAFSLFGLYAPIDSAEVATAWFLFGGPILYTLLPKGHNRHLAIQFYVQHFKLIFYSSAVLFGAVHIANFDPRIWIYAPLLISPQILLGLFFGFVRLRYGLHWAIFSHSLHNLCFSIPLLVAIWAS